MFPQRVKKRTGGESSNTAQTPPDRLVAPSATLGKRYVEGFSKNRKGQSSFRKNGIPAVHLSGRVRSSDGGNLIAKKNLILSGHRTRQHVNFRCNMMRLYFLDLRAAYIFFALVGQQGTSFSFSRRTTCLFAVVGASESFVLVVSLKIPPKLTTHPLAKL